LRRKGGTDGRPEEDCRRVSVDAGAGGVVVRLEGEQEDFEDGPVLLDESGADVVRGL